MRAVPLNLYKESKTMKQLQFETKQDFIPIQLIDNEGGTHEFRFDYDDKRLTQYQEGIRSHIDKLVKMKNNSSFSDNDAALGEAFEFLLGKGSYKKVKKVQTSIINRTTLLYDIIKAIDTEWDELKAPDDEDASEFIIEK